MYTICRQEYESDEELYIFPCSHAVHISCADPWLLSTREHLCLICRRDIFLTPYPSDDDDNSVNPTRDHQIERRTTHSLGASVSDYTHPINESSASDADADGEDVSILPGQSIVNRITTTDLVFNQPQTNTEHYSHPQLPRVVLRQASPEEKDNNNITTTVSYGSFHDSPSGLFTTPLAANSLAGSLDGTSDDTNILARSAIEGITDMKTDDIIEPSHAALPHGSDQANILNRTTKTD